VARYVQFWMLMRPQNMMISCELFPEIVEKVIVISPFSTFFRGFKQNRIDEVVRKC
jgi:hypothetical protein